MAETVFPHKDIVKLSYEMVAVVGHGNSDHGEGDYVVSGEKKHLCNIYDLPDCKTHEAMTQALSRMKLIEGVRGTPTHIIYNPHDLTEISRAHYMAVSQIEDAIAEAQKKLGKPVRWRSYQKMRSTLDTANALVEEGDYRKALRELKGFDPEGMENLKEEAEAIHETILEKGRARIDEAKALIEAGDTDKARNLLREIRRDFDKTEIEDQAKELFDSLSD